MDLLNKILDITQESYKQENSRASNLLTKSDYLIKYVTGAFALINVIFVFIAVNKLINLWSIGICYLIIAITMLFCMIYSIRAQILKLGKYFPSGKQILLDIVKKYKEEVVEYNDQKMINETIIYYSEYIEQLEIVNNDRADLINKSYKLFLVSIIEIIVTFFMFIISLII